MPKYVPYSNNIHYKQIRKKLRQESTKAEQTVWKFIRAKQLGVKFRRQYSIDRYIVDFYCHELQLIIEIDGGIHGEEKIVEKDNIRQQWLEDHGYRIIRFTNEQVINNTESVYTVLVQKISEIQNSNNT